MSMSHFFRRALTRTGASRVLHLLAAAAATLVLAGTANAQVSQTPLYLGGGNVPGNLVLVPSVEFPTIISVANLGDYGEDQTYIGYFDPGKCYIYSYDGNEAERHFYPSRFTSDHRCSGDHEWSGNFLNWAATQTIDPFRLVLTGGYRVRDSATETWLEKASSSGQGNRDQYYPDRRINGRYVVRGATPFAADWVEIGVHSLGSELRFRPEGGIRGGGVDVRDYAPGDDYWDSEYTWDDEHGWRDNAYEASVRIAVCVPGMLESNCRAYDSGSKPEGLIQQYADDLRYSVFGYLNDHDMRRDGGALRARQKFVGPQRIVPGTGRVANPDMEWDAATGQLLDDPDHPDGAAGTNISDSGVINYLNKFGQMTSKSHKEFDPVSEMFYAALRYLQNRGNVPEYTNMGGSSSNIYELADGFPVITDWEDPIEYACQKNVFLGIGDVNTHRDKNLPGSTSGADEPAKPAAVSSDDTVDVITWTNRLAAHEGLPQNANTSSWSGRNNSAYIAGLAYFANTTDIRPGNDMPGEQTVSTHWVDVLENQTLEPPERNQYFLAAKFGGFRVPDGEEFDPESFSGDLPVDWWHTNDETLGTGVPRPDNYYTAGEADAMVESLTQAFARISAELRSSASSVAANSTRVDSDTAVFQAAFDSHRWSGELQAYRIDSSGEIAGDPQWNAASRLDALLDSEIGSRRVFTSAPPAAVSGGAYVSTTAVDFEWADLTSAQQDELRGSAGGDPLVSAAVGADRLDYLRGDRSLEQPDGFFRQRDSRLGDIVNSDPQFIHQQDFGYSLLVQSSAFPSSVAAAYRTFRQSSTYRNRPPMVVVGANDGMLHGFHAGLDDAGGAELFAFVPDAALEHMYELTLPDYSHRYYVDGTPRVADAYLGGGMGWRTIAVGATGAGGNSVFALDITDPGSMTSSDVLWEFTHPDLGYTLGQPAVTPLPNGEFGVVVTSGYGGSGSGRIWILDPADGSITTTISLPDSGELGAPLLADLDGDRVADRLYVGDTEGKLWRIDFEGSSPGSWAPPDGLVSGGTPQPLFIATDADGNPQAITAPPTSAFNEAGEHGIFFGTGSFYRIDDNVVPDNPSVDGFYGIIDRGEPIASRDELVEQEIMTEQVVNGRRVRAVTDNEMTSGNDGWFVDLVWKNSYGGPGPKGERVVSRAVVRDDRVIVTTLIPDADPCSPGGDSWLMELDAFNGGRLDYAVFDIDDDGEFDDGDWITVSTPDGDIEVPASGVAPEIGIMETPAVISGIGEDQDEIKVVSGSSGQLIRITERGGIGIGRQSWRQLR